MICAQDVAELQFTAFCFVNLSIVHVQKVVMHSVAKCHFLSFRFLAGKFKFSHASVASYFYLNENQFSLFCHSVYEAFITIECKLPTNLSFFGNFVQQGTAGLVGFQSMAKLHWWDKSITTLNALLAPTAKSLQAPPNTTLSVGKITAENAGQSSWKIVPNAEKLSKMKPSDQRSRENPTMQIAFVALNVTFLYRENISLLIMEFFARKILR